MFRGYDSSEVFCEDTLLRIKNLYHQIVTMQKSLVGRNEALKQANLAAPKPNPPVETEPGTGHPTKKRGNNNDPE